MINFVTFEGVNSSGKTTAANDLHKRTGWPIFKQLMTYKDIDAVSDAASFVKFENYVWEEFTRLLYDFIRKNAYHQTIILDRGAWSHRVYAVAKAQDIDICLSNLPKLSVKEKFPPFEQTLIYFPTQHKQQVKIKDSIHQKAKIEYEQSLGATELQLKYPLFSYKKIFYDYQDYLHDLNV